MTNNHIGTAFKVFKDIATAEGWNYRPRNIDGVRFQGVHSIPVDALLNPKCGIDRPNRIGNDECHGGGSCELFERRERAKEPNPSLRQIRIHGE